MKTSSQVSSLGMKLPLSSSSKVINQAHFDFVVDASEYAYSYNNLSFNSHQGQADDLFLDVVVNES